MIQRYIAFIILLVSTLIPVTDCIAAAQDKELIMGIFPRRDPLTTNRMFSPLANYLSEKLGVKVILRTPKNFQSFWESLENREFDIVHLNQYQYIKSHKPFKYDVIVKNIEFGESTIAGAILVRKDSGISDVSDLKGKVIVFGGGKTAMQSYIVARHLLQVNGLKAGDYKESFAKNPPNAIMSTFFKQSAAAGSGDKVLKLKIVKSQIDINEMKYLVRGEQLAHLPWAVKSDMSKIIRDEIRDNFVKLGISEAGKKILKKMHLDGFAITSDSEYNPHRKIIMEVLQERY